MTDTKSEKATFAMGCFWGVQALFKSTPGVIKATSGYTGGHLANPSYEKVCTGTTGHAEAVEVEFDPSRISYEKLLDLFWEHHDPTTYHRQGPDVGEQYRSGIFYHSDVQKRLAEESRDRLSRNHRYLNPIVTEILPAKEFYPAEEYHQDYAEKHPDVVCHI
ncbi:peptide-methionine (S)-S-oxide reductase MsrA [Candidatus Parcubacteria bacterium]|nr:peptide-methionine (S)-S-oxide reductase MsrA [Candidatus Parcubacteria bacterium]